MESENGCLRLDKTKTQTSLNTIPRPIRYSENYFNILIILFHFAE